MTCRFQEFYQISRRNRRCRGIDERMTVDERILHQGLVQEHLHLAFSVIDRPKRRHRAGRYAEQFKHCFGLAKRYFAGSANQMVDGFQVNNRVFIDRQQKVIVFLVFQKQIFGMPALQFPAQALRICNGEKRRVGNGRHFNAERINKAEKLFGRFWWLGHDNLTNFCNVSWRLAICFLSLKINLVPEICQKSALSGIIAVAFTALFRHIALAAAKEAARAGVAQG